MREINDKNVFQQCTFRPTYAGDSRKRKKKTGEARAKGNSLIAMDTLDASMLIHQIIGKKFINVNV